MTNSAKHYKSLILTVGFAIFAMFFGAGNLVFPLMIGAHAGMHLTMGIFGFVLSGVLMPALGLFAISLYHGDYFEFLASIGRVSAFIVTLVLILLLGILIASPRTSTLAYGTFKPFFNHPPQTSVIFNGIYFSLVLVCSMYRERIMDLIGYFLSPLKLGTLLLLVIIGLISVPHHIVEHRHAYGVFKGALVLGYGTMDLLASFFFCAFVYKAITLKTRKDHLNEKQVREITLKACVMGALLLAFVYICFICVANQQAAALQHIPTDAMVGAVAKTILPGAAAVFVAICVTLACFSTALALNTVTVDFLDQYVLGGRVSYKILLVLVTVSVFLCSNAGFAKIMAIGVPILSVLYPALIGLTLVNILRKLNVLRQKFWAPLVFYGLLISVLIAHC